jgi:catechol 2,3-dioxygenase-like lactoylglutathione lyase family enzyme
MKRLHVHVAVADLGQSISFYSTLFGAEPGVRKDDYAKWMLDDPRVNFAISQRGEQPGLSHLGLQAENAAELEEIGARLKAAGAVTLSEQNISCCYAQSDKYWAEDPQGVRWESFHTHGATITYSTPKPAAQTDSPHCSLESAAAPGSRCCG